MKLFVFAVLAFGVVANAQDDGRYRPGSYGGDDGQYRPGNDGQYVNTYVNNRYDSVGAANYVNRYQAVRPSYNQNIAAYRPPVVVTPAPQAYYPQQTSYVRAQQGNERNARILKLDSRVDIDGYQYYYQTENGINAEETGKLQSTATGPGIRASGFYEYVGDDGVTYRVDYTADENGFHPSGAHLPQIPRN